MVPNPWIALEARTDLLLVRASIPEPARYYDCERTIVMRRGLLISEERRYLWHELVHADRHDQCRYTTSRTERNVDRTAVQWAIPPATLWWAWGQATDWDEFAGLLKVPEDWARFRVQIAHPAERAMLRREEG